MRKLHHAESLANPNAWISEIGRLTALLDRVYTHTSGEIWLFDNDLRVLEDHEGAFTAVYKNQLDGSLRTRVNSVKILLRRELYDRFCDARASPQLFANLCSLSPDRLRTFYVGVLESAKPRKAVTLVRDDPWVFYLGTERLRSRKGIVIVRPKRYPFTHSHDSNEDIAIAWSTVDTDLETLNFRLKRDLIDEVFTDKLDCNFGSIVPIVNENNETAGYTLGPPLAPKDLWPIVQRLRSEESIPVVAPVDCAIVTALNEEFKAVCDELLLTPSAEPGYATGWLGSGDATVSVVATMAVRSGSVDAAVATARVIHKWSPKTIFLVGRCGGYEDDSGGREFKECDVVVSGVIRAYEYQAWKLKQNDEPRVEYDARDIHVSDVLLREAKALIREGWEFIGELPLDFEAPRPKAEVGGFACGCKLIRQGKKWFDEIRPAVSGRNIVAVEMEGEGVGRAALASELSPHFLMIKGISDYADPRKSDKYKDLASRTSAQFLRCLLERPACIKTIEGLR